MKKLILAFAICLIPAKVMSANFVDTLGSECARLLLKLDVYDYPKYYDQFKNRNSQFYALEQCLKIYKQVGGDFEDLNRKYSLAKEIATHDFYLCTLNKKAGDEECSTNHYLFKDVITNSYCATLDLINNKYPNFNYKNILEILCSKETNEPLKNIEKK